MFIYRKDPTLEVGDMIGRYTKSGELLRAKIVKLTPTHIFCEPRRGDFVVEEMPFVWQGRYIRIPKTRVGIGLWEQLRMTSAPYLYLQDPAKILKINEKN